MKTLNDAGIARLRCAVVIAACDDWLSAVADLKTATEGGLIWSRKKDVKENCERFFFSERFTLFCDIEPFTLLNRLEELSEQGRRTIPNKPVEFSKRKPPFHL